MKILRGGHTLSTACGQETVRGYLHGFEFEANALLSNVDKLADIITKVESSTYATGDTFDAFSSKFRYMISKV